VSAIVGGACTHAQIELANIVFRHQDFTGIISHDPAQFHDVAMLRGRERDRCVLLDHQDGGAKFSVDLGEDGKNLAREKGREPKRGLIKQQQRGPRHESATDGKHLLFAAREKPCVLLRPLEQTRKPAMNAREFIAVAKKNPGKLNFSSSGSGSTQHLSGEMLKQRAGINIVHVPYKGGAPAASDLLAGHVPMMFEMGYSALPSIKAGKIRALAVTSSQRIALLPDVPTASEAALPGYITESWNGIMTTGGTPRSVIDTLSRAMLRVMATDNMKNRMMTLGADVTPLGPDEFAAYVRADDKRLTPIIKSLDMKSN